MQVTASFKHQVIQTISDDMARKSGKGAGMTDTRHANYLGISTSIYSRIKKGETEKLLSQGEWVRIGMELGVDMDGLGWKAGQTATYVTIKTQLETCQQNSLSAIFCDEKGIGKTFAAKDYARNHPNVAYVDCSQCKTKRELIRAIARRFGFEYTGKLTEVRQNMIDNILTLYKPILILDEVGDLNYDATLELKAIWNALEGLCAFYLMGANGLAKKMEKNIRNRTVGYEEIFDRMGDRFQEVTKTLTAAEKAQFKRHQCEIVLLANLPKIKQAMAKQMISDSNLNLRRLRLDIVKHQTVSA